MILVLGSYGHVGFNETGAFFHSRTHFVDLDKTKIENNTRFFQQKEDVPKKVGTMGVNTIFNNKEILLLV